LRDFQHPGAGNPSHIGTVVEVDGARDSPGDFLPLAGGFREDQELGFLRDLQRFQEGDQIPGRRLLPELDFTSIKLPLQAVYESRLSPGAWRVGCGGVALGQAGQATRQRPGGQDKKEARVAELSELGIHLDLRKFGVKSRKYSVTAMRL
jgi:hypothetical protein